MPFQVRVCDLFHYLDPDEFVFRDGVFDTAQEALERCRRIVEESVAEVFKPGMTAEEIFSAYMTFGEDPFIEGPGAPNFSGTGYAREVAARLTRGEVDDARGAGPT